MIKVLFFLSSHKIGLSSLLVEQAINFKSLQNLHFTYVAGENEQEPGLKSKLLNHQLMYHEIEGIDDHHNFFDLVKSFRKLIKTIQPDIVHVQTNWQLVIAIIAKLFLIKQYRIAYTIHGYRHNHKYKSWIALAIIQSLLFFFAHHVFAASQTVYQKFSLLKKKMSVLYLGVESSFFNRSYPSTKETTTIKIIFTAQFREGKNQALLINTIHKYIQATGDSSIILTLPGEGPLKKECIQLSKSLNLINNVLFPGQITRDQIIQYYLDSNIAIIPSNSETFGHAIAEPFVLGMCVISRDTGVAPDVIRNAHNGFIFNKDNEILNILISLYKNHALIDTCASNAFLERDIFRWETIAQQYENYLLRSTSGDTI